MASAQVVETSVTNNSPSQDSYHPDDLFQSRYATPIFQPLRARLHSEFQPGLKFRSAHRAEILLWLHAQFQPGRKTQISMREFIEVWKHSQCACSRSFFSPGWNSVSITWDFFRFSGPFGRLKILAQFEHTGLGFSAWAELRPWLNPSPCNRQFGFQRICFRSRAEISAWDEIRHVIRPWLKKFLAFCYLND